MKKTRIGLAAMALMLTVGATIITSKVKADPADSCNNSPSCNKQTLTFCCNVYDAQGHIIDVRFRPLN